MSKTALAIIVGLVLVAAVGQAWAFAPMSEPPKVSVGNWVFVDNPPVGTMGDPLETADSGNEDVGIDGAIVELSVSESGANVWTTWGTATTSAGGYYQFDGLAAGKDYRVVVVSLPAGYESYFQTYERGDDADGVALNRASVHSVAATDVSSWGAPGDFNFDFGFVPYEPGGWTTYTQGVWGAKPSGNNPGTLLRDNWWRITTQGPLVVGGNYALTFTDWWEVTNFLPQGGTPGVLGKNYPPWQKKTEAGVLAGQVVALRLNVDFSAMGVTAAGLGGLKIQSGTYKNWTVDQLLGLAETVLGGGTTGLLGSISDLSDACTAVNENFDNGADLGFLR